MSPCSSLRSALVGDFPLSGLASFSLDAFAAPPAVDVAVADPDFDCCCDCVDGGGVLDAASSSFDACVFSSTATGAASNGIA